MSTLNTLLESIKNYFEMLQVGAILIWKGFLEAVNAKDYTLRHKGDK